MKKLDDICLALLLITLMLSSSGCALGKKVGGKEIAKFPPDHDLSKVVKYNRLLYLMEQFKGWERLVLSPFQGQGNLSQDCCGKPKTYLIYASSHQELFDLALAEKISLFVNHKNIIIFQINDYYGRWPETENMPSVNAVLEYNLEKLRPAEFYPDTISPVLDCTEEFMVDSKQTICLQELDDGWYLRFSKNWIEE